MQAKDKTLVAIVGPTASGKTALSIQIAQVLGTEILSADSRQFYREMHIGTAKPSPEEQAKVQHHFIDSHSINDDYNIACFEAEALKVLEEIFTHKKTAVMVGGSGLYIKAVCEGMDEIPDTDPEVRENLMELYQREGMAELLQELERVDPAFFLQADKANPHRIIRALEVARSTGLPFSSFRKGQKKERDFDVLKVGLLWEREELYARIDRRMDQMIEEGLFGEAERLYPYRHKNALQTVGYKEIFDWMDGKYSKEEAIRLLKRNSRRYAKRQMTWFNKDKEIAWMDANKPEEIQQYILEKLSAK